MTSVDLPAPVVRPDAPPAIDAEGLAAALASRVDGEVRFDDGRRAAYSTDASNFRQVPIGVVVPRSVDAAEIYRQLRALRDAYLALVGSESTAVTVLRAELKLVPVRVLLPRLRESDVDAVAGQERGWHRRPR